jgi:hypothetical protein
VIVFGGGIARGDPVPSFCEQFPKESLEGLKAPYGPRALPDGSIYCEGLLPRRAGAPLLRIISAKQLQDAPILETSLPARALTLTWCDDAAAKPSVSRVRLRAIGSPLYALDAERSGGRFAWQPDPELPVTVRWKGIAALVTKRATVGAAPRDVIYPVRIGAGTDSSYVLTVASGRAPALAYFVVEDATSAVRSAIEVKLNAKPAAALDLVLPMGQFPPGIYRVSISERADGGGRTTDPIYLSHRQCP